MTSTRLSIATLLLVSAPALGQGEWPQFRGPGGLSVADDTPIPLAFGPDSQVLWKADLPSGHSSPCIWDDRIFVTGFENDICFVVALDRGTGIELWRRSFRSDPHPEYAHEDAVPALPTACTDGEHVVVYHGAYGLVAFDTDGQVEWEKRMSHPGYGFGIGTSPIIAGGNVIVSRDGAPEAAILALKLEDGTEAWKIDRFEFIESHGTPVLWRNADREELVIGGTGQVCSFDPKDGEPLWNVTGVTIFSCTTPAMDADTLYYAAWSTPNSSGRSFWEAGVGRSIEVSDEEVADPNLLFDRLDTNDDDVLVRDEIPESRMKDAFAFLDRNGNGTVERPELVNVTDGPQAPGANIMVAIRRGGEGDVTDTHVAWTYKRGLPYVSSPLLYRGKIWLVKSGGMITCLDAKSGEAVFSRERLSDRSEFYMSPVGAAGKVLIGSAEGGMYVLNAESKELEVVHSAAFGTGLFATPAVVDGKVYLRGAKTLWAFGAEK